MVKKELIREVLGDVGNSEQGISAGEEKKDKYKMKKKLHQCLTCVSTSILKAVTGFGLYHF